MALDSSIAVAQLVLTEVLPRTYFSNSLCYIDNIASKRFGIFEKKRWAVYDPSKFNKVVLRTDYAAYVCPKDFNKFYEMSRRAAPGSLVSVIRLAGERRYRHMGGRMLVLDEEKDEFLNPDDSPIITKLDFPHNISDNYTPRQGDTNVVRDGNSNISRKKR